MADEWPSGADRAQQRKGAKRKAESRDRGGRWQVEAGSVLVYRSNRQDNSQAWLLTFTDLSALMLTFFVLLFSMSSIQESQWQNLVDALSTRLPSMQEVTVTLPASDKQADAVQRVPGTDLDYLAAVLKDTVTADPVLKQATVRREGDRLVISVPGDLLFASGSTKLGKAGQKAVFALGGVLRSLRNAVEIAGYADPRQPLGTYPSNWELSLARAAAVSGMLNKVGYRGNIVVRGYGQALFDSIDPSLDQQTRMAKARRVDIIVHAYAWEEPH